MSWAVIPSHAEKECIVTEDNSAADTKKIRRNKTQLNQTSQRGQRRTEGGAANLQDVFWCHAGSEMHPQLISSDQHFQRFLFVKDLDRLIITNDR